MPIFEYECRNCGKIFEFLCFRSGEDTGISCPSCGATTTEKVLSTFSSASPGLGVSESHSCSPSGGFS
ncbi:MAG: zinc ribbon domain-containing protein [Thermodesulfobacteriota bacterium]|nr:zinc ribbon domain-containing protein [Thermodesulfobacteriota bacterium]